MKPETNPPTVTASLNRRTCLKRLLLGTAAIATAGTAEATLTSNQIPTQMSVSLSTASARRGTRVTITARLTRVDTGAGVGSASIRFMFGSPTYPTTTVATAVYTNSSGVATFTFTVSNYTKLGRNIVVAEFKGNNMFAQPLPFANLNVTSSSSL